MADRTHDGKAYRMLTVIDEFSRECLAIVVGRKIDSSEVLYTLADLFIRSGIPAHIRSDNGPEFCAKAVREWLGRLGVGTLFIEPGSFKSLEFDGDSRGILTLRYGWTDHGGLVTRGSLVQIQSSRPYNLEGLRIPGP